jgi:hypothetical protein
MTQNHAEDLVVLELATSEAALAERVVDLKSENAWLRLTVREAVAQLHRLTLQCARYEARVVSLVYELRALQAQLRAARERAA